MPMKVMSTDTGIEIAVTRVERIENRKMRMMITANRRPSSPSWARLLIDSWMNGAWSNTTVNFVLLPIAFSRSGIASRTSWETETVLPSGDLVTAMVTDSSPFTREIPVTGSSLIVTSATSPMVVYSRPPSNGSVLMSSVLVIFEPAWTVSVLPSSVIWPAGSSTPLSPRASRMDWVLTPAASSLASSGRMVTRWVVAPVRLASLTPSIWRRSARVEPLMAAARSWSLRSLVTEIWMTGRSLKLKVRTWGSTPSGSWVLMRLIASCTFCSAVVMLVP